MPLKKLIVENFQSIKERTEFDLNKLVLLFGPNSAGKSIIEDALSFSFEQFSFFENTSFTASQFRSWDSGADTAVSRNWRRNGMSYADFCYVGLGGSFDPNSESAWLGSGDSESRAFEWLYEVKWCRDDETFQDVLGRPSMETVWREWFLSIDGRLLLSSEGIHLSHPLLADFERALRALISGPIHHLCDLTLEDGLLSNGTGMELFPAKQEGLIWQYLLESKSDVDWREEVVFDSEVHELLKNVVTVICSRMSATYRVAFQPIAISDSRKIPSPRDLSFVFHDLIQPETCLLGNTVSIKLREEKAHISGNNLADPLGMNPDTTDLFRELASGYFCKLPDLWIESEEIFEYSEWFDRVNKLLADFLFIDNGYQLDGQHAYILSGSELDTLAEEGLSHRNKLRAQIALTLMLRDAKGQKLHFNEVGSGVGYVLPILISLASDRDLINKQPELHLHPALQSQLGDLYLQAARDDRYMIVETHSEHLLLRLLRRIRQRTSKRLDEEDYRFATPEDVSIYYFEPQGDGETKVRPIRISPDGDFLDPWPGGFFEERYEDLFNE